jgi:hypothetical protein
MNFIISYPRSGQHMVASILEYLVIGHGMEYSYCDFYNCCYSIPCKKGSIFQKNHDFDENISITSENKYLVLYRKDPILQLEAYARYMNTTSFEGMCHFMCSKWHSYDRFVQKWCHSHSEPSNILVFDYYELLASPVENLKTIFHHFYPDITPIPEVWDTILSQTFFIHEIQRPIQSPRVMDFEYYHRLRERME